MTKNEFVKELEICGKKIKLGLDDYGQSYFIEWEENGKTEEIGLGTYNFHYMESIYHMFDPRYKELSRKELFGEDLTEEESKELKEYHEKFEKIYLTD